MNTIKWKRFLFVLWMGLICLMGLDPAKAWARATATGVISYVAPVYLSGMGTGDGAALNMDGGDEYIIIQGHNGGYSSCGGSMWSGYAYVRPDHPNKRELYTLFLTSRAMNQEVTCTYETGHPDDNGGCIIVYCSL